MPYENRNIPMGTLVKIDRVGFAGSIGRIYGRCNNSALYNINGERGIWYGEPLTWHDGRTRGFDINLFPSEFSIFYEEG